MSRWKTKVGDGKYRLSYMDGKLIGIEIWPEPEEGKPRGYFIYNVKRRERPRAVKWLLGLRGHR